MTAFVDPSARLEASAVGEGSRILAYVRVASEATIGRDCVVHDHAVLAGPVTLEDGVHIGPGSVVGDDGSASSPREVTIRRFASVGANVTVVPGVVIGRNAVVEPGSVVRESVPANAVVRGNPATIVSYVDGARDAPAPLLVPREAGAEEVVESRVRGVALHRLTHARDLRGSLTAAEFPELPFEPRRIFTVYDVPSASVRGAHAHRECEQFLVCLRGSLSCLVDDGSAREEITLSRPEIGLHIPPMVWGTQWNYTGDAVLLVLASHPYDAADYIRDYEEFLSELSGRGSEAPA